MKENRSLLELLILLRRELRSDYCDFNVGLCRLVLVLETCLIINKEEAEALINFIYNNGNYPLHGWKPGVKAPRDRFLTENINRLKKLN
jgi:hypothetical protein